MDGHSKITKTHALADQFYLSDPPFLPVERSRHKLLEPGTDTQAPPSDCMSAFYDEGTIDQKRLLISA